MGTACQLRVRAAAPSIKCSGRHPELRRLPRWQDLHGELPVAPQPAGAWNAMPLLAANPAKAGTNWVGSGLGQMRIGLMHICTSSSPAVQTCWTGFTKDASGKCVQCPADCVSPPGAWGVP